MKKFKTDVFNKRTKAKRPRRTVKNVVIESFGFPVILSRAEEFKFENEWVLDVDYKEIAEALVDYLLEFHRPLTGAQMRFIRKHLRLRQEDLAERLSKAQPHIARAENKGNKLAFESYADQLALIIHFQSELARQRKQDPLFDNIFSAEDFSESVEPKVFLNQPEQRNSLRR